MRGSPMRATSLPHISPASSASSRSRSRRSSFQKQVSTALVQIPFGETTSYAALASALGHAGSARAVGAANRTNPIGIVVPCHRVIGADGTLTGYAGGIERK
jgi:O-6-methylguanine DNA methyltransferase